jgi:hypothetical protein
MQTQNLSLPLKMKKTPINTQLIFIFHRYQMRLNLKLFSFTLSCLLRFKFDLFEPYQHSRDVFCLLLDFANEDFAARTLSLSSIKTEKQ